MSGLYLDAYTDNQFLFASGDSVKIYTEAIKRNGQVAVSLKNISIYVQNRKIATKPVNKLLDLHKIYTPDLKKAPLSAAYSQPYWLASTTMYQWRPEAGNPSDIVLKYVVEIAGETFEYTVPVLYKDRDPIKGEVRKPIYFVPKVGVSVAQEFLLFTDKRTKTIDVVLTAYTENASGQININASNGWEVTPSVVNFSFANIRQTKRIQLSVRQVGNNSENGRLSYTVKTGNESSDLSVQLIDYNHIPAQVWLPKVQTQLIPIELNVPKDKIAYIQGAGDKVLSILQSLNFNVQEISPNVVLNGEAGKYATIVLGIRAFNVLPQAKNLYHKLMEYVQLGGNVVVQYTTTRGLKVDNIGPFPIQLSHNRVTVEDAKVRILEKDHLLLNFPNKISQDDFKNWVQERGLYFAESWAKQYKPIFAIAEPNGKPYKGSLIVAKYGKGRFIYTGLSFFRELPAGVPGAIRLFTNLLFTPHPLPAANDTSK